MQTTTPKVVATDDAEARPHQTVMILGISECIFREPNAPHSNARPLQLLREKTPSTAG
jgi:hypothetical protein